MDKINQFKLNNKIEYVILSIIIIIAIVLRFYKINIPLTDHHSWRQADTAAVARNFAKSTIDLLHPQLDNMAPTHSPDYENPRRLYLVEFPIYNAIIALVYKLIGIKEAYGRIITILFSLISLAVLYLITKNYFGRLIGLLTAFFFAIIPFNVYFSRVILPEPMMIAMVLSGIYFFDLWLNKEKRRYLFLSLFFTSLAFLVKPYSLFLIPVYIFLAFNKKGLKGLINPLIILFGIISVIPLLIWRKYILTMPEGVPASGWLLNEEGIRLTGAFFHWLIFERMDRLIMTIGGMFLFLLGLIIKPGKKENWLFHAWLLSILIYFVVFAKGNVTHDYYQIIFVPIACIFMAKGAAFLLKPATEYVNKYFCYLLFVFCCLSITAFGWYEVRNFYNLQMGVDLAGKAVDQLTPKNSLVITGDTADVTLLYNCNRFGWAIGYGAAYPVDPEIIKRLKDKGAAFFVTTKVNDVLSNKDLNNYFTENAKILKKTNEFIIFDLRQ